MKAVGYKGHLGCIEILKAKAAIMFDRFCVNKAQQEVESQKKRGGKRQQWKKLQYIIACYFTVKTGGRTKMCSDRQFPFKLKSVFTLK